MRRRDFVRRGLVASTVPSLPGVWCLPGAADARGAGTGIPLRADLIWSSVSDPVPLVRAGPALGDAAAVRGFSPGSVPDLHTVFVREFALDRVPARAQIRLFACTRYRLYVNGTYAGRGPSRYQNEHPEYDVRDIVAMLRTGPNIVAVLVHRDAPTGRIMRHTPGFAASIELSDGRTRRTIATDTRWKARPDPTFGPRNEAWSSIEERIDARAGEDFTAAGFSAVAWPAAIVAGGPPFASIGPRSTPLQRETPRDWTSAPALPVVLASGDGCRFSLPELVQGYHAIDLEATAGAALEIAYLLPEGDRSGTNTYVARAGAARYIGGDTFAFKELAIRATAGTVTLRRVEAIEVRYPFTRVASFASSDPFLDRLWAICARSAEVLSEDAYVDCADRERVEWTDVCPPSFECTRVMMAGPDDGNGPAWGDPRLLAALLMRIADTQQSDGQLKAHSCSERFDIHAIMEDRSCDWVMLLRAYFDATGDERLVRELWPTVVGLMAWFADHTTARGLILAREWEVWDNPLRYQICEGAGLNALVYRAFGDAEVLGRAIGMASDADTFAARAARLRTDFNRLLWSDTDGTYFGALFGPGSKTNAVLNVGTFTGPIVDGRFRPTAQAALFALFCGIVPADRVGPLRSWLLAHLDEVTGAMSHYYLFDALYAMASEEQDRKVLRLMREGWRAQVESPWQTTWESLSDDGGSKIHSYGMVPGYFLTAYVLGVRRRGSIADRTILVEPRCGDLSTARGTAVTEFGPVTIAWTNGPDGITIDCTLPSGVTSLLRLYTRAGQTSIIVDGSPRLAQTNGPFIELTLPPGRRQIIYGELQSLHTS